MYGIEKIKKLRDNKTRSLTGSAEHKIMSLKRAKTDGIRLSFKRKLK